jgi:hypothetical protein
LFLLPQMSFKSKLQIHGQKRNGFSMTSTLMLALAIGRKEIRGHYHRRPL